MRALQELVDAARVRATARAIVSEKPFTQVLHEHSRDADCVFLGFRIPAEGHEQEWHAGYQALLADMPPVVMVRSSGREDMQA